MDVPRRLSGRKAAITLIRVFKYQEKGGQAFSRKVVLVVGGWEEGGHLYLDFCRHTGYCYTQKGQGSGPQGCEARGATTIRIVTTGATELREDWGGRTEAEGTRTCPAVPSSPGNPTLALGMTQNPSRSLTT